MPSGRFSRLCVYVSRLPLSCCLCFFVVENGLGCFFLMLYVLCNINAS